MNDEQAVVTNKVDKKLPAGQTFTLGLQHVCKRQVNHHIENKV
jgi:xanthine/uracil permease